MGLTRSGLTNEETSYTCVCCLGSELHHSPNMNQYQRKVSEHAVCVGKGIRADICSHALPIQWEIMVVKRSLVSGPIFYKIC